MKRFLVCSLALNLLLGGFILYRRLSRTVPVPLETPLYLSQVDVYNSLPRKPVEIIFVGDSLTAFGPWTELVDGALNRGVPGDLVRGVRARLDEVLGHNPKKLFLMIGINDLLLGSTGVEVLAEYRALIDEIRTRAPECKIYLQGILPINQELYGSELRYRGMVNDGLKKQADNQFIYYVDLGMGSELDKQYTRDGLHLTGAGYARWREALKQHLED